MNTCTNNMDQILLYGFGFSLLALVFMLVFVFAYMIYCIISGKGL
jgi:hypothetical protein